MLVPRTWWSSKPKLCPEQLHARQERDWELRSTGPHPTLTQLLCCPWLDEARCMTLRTRDVIGASGEGASGLGRPAVQQVWSGSAVQMCPQLSPHACDHWPPFPPTQLLEGETLEGHRPSVGGPAGCLWSSAASLTLAAIWYHHSQLKLLHGPGHTAPSVSL